MFQETIVWGSSLIYNFYEDKVASKRPNRIQDSQILLCHNQKKNPCSIVDRQTWFCGIILIHLQIIQAVMLPEGLQLNL